MGPGGHHHWQAVALAHAMGGGVTSQAATGARRSKMKGAPDNARGPLNTCCLNDDTRRDSRGRGLRTCV